MAFGGQLFKKRNGGPNNGGDEESTFVVGEGNIEIPEIDGIMQQIERTISQADSRSAMIREEEQEQEQRRGCGCW